MDSAPILHRDIKSENILLTKDLEPRLADLGEARAMAHDRTMTMVGTQGYTAPEVCVCCGANWAGEEVQLVVFASPTHPFAQTKQARGKALWHGG